MTALSYKCKTFSLPNICPPHTCPSPKITIVDICPSYLTTTIDNDPITLNPNANRGHMSAMMFKEAGVRLGQMFEHRYAAAWCSSDEALWMSGDCGLCVLFPE